MGPPGDGAAPVVSRGSEKVGHRAERVDTSTVSDQSDIPLYRSREFSALPLGDPRRLVSMRRAADCWWSEGQPAVIRARLVDELEACDLISRWRIRMCSHDVHDALDDWPRAYSVVQARAAEYVPPEWTPTPWTSAQLDMSA
jgi:hypothetical protein